MPGNNQITFGVGFNVNESGLNKLKQSLKEIQQLTAKDIAPRFGNDIEQAKQQLNQVKKEAVQLEMALSKAFNPQLGTTNLIQFQTALRGMNIKAIASDFNNLGAVGQNAFNALATSVMTGNVKLKQTFSLLENIKTTLTNTIKWNIASSAINSFTGSISNAFNYVKALDSSLTDIRIVTGQSREEMAAFADQANTAAQALGRQTKEYTNAALAYYQQGLSAQEVQDRTIATLKAQNITGAGTEMTDYLTAVWNGYKATNDEIELYVDKLALVADSSASNLAELATGMSKVAATANNMGVTIDQLTAQLSTIIATTRQAPETVGNALKTIYARINDIKAGTDEADISLGNYTKKMADLGINVLDSNNELRATGEVMEEIGARWSNMTREQQVYLAQTMAGQRQMNNLLALFDNWTQYSEMLNVSLNAQGTLNEKNSRYMESLSAHINQFKAAVEGMQDALIDEESINSVVDAGTNLVNVFNNLLTSIGGVKTASFALGGVLLNLFSSNLATGLTNFIVNLQTAKDNAALLKNEFEIIQQFQNADKNGTVGQISAWSAQANQLQQNKIISEQERNSLNDLIQQYNEFQGKLNIWVEAKERALEYFNVLQEGKEPISDIATQGSQAFKSQEKVLEERKIDLENINDELNTQIRLLNRVQNLSKQAGTQDATAKTFNTYRQQQQSLYDELLENFQAMQAAVSDPKKWGLDANSPIITKLKDQLIEFEDELTDIDLPEGYAEKQIQAYQELVSAAQQANAEIVQTFKDGATGVEEAYRTGLQSVRATIEKELQIASLKETLQGVVGVISSLTTAFAGLQSILNATKILQNENLSTSEKWLQSLTALGSGLLMLINGLSRFGNSLNLIRSGLVSLAASSDMAAARTAFLIAMEKAKTEEEKKAAIASYNHAASMATEAVAAQGLSYALKKVTVSLIEMLAPFAPLLLAIGAVVGVVGGLYLAATNEERALKKTQKAAEESANKYQELKTSYDELQASLKDYHEARDALSELTKGTEEWKEQVEEINQQVLSLLEKYPQLAKYVQKDAQGNYSLDEEGFQAFDQEQRQELARQNITQYVDKLRNNQQEQIAKEIEPAAKEFRKASSEYTLDNNTILELIELYQTFDEQLKERIHFAADASEALNQWEFEVDDVIEELSFDNGLTDEDFRSLGMSLEQFSKLIRTYKNDFVDLLESGGQYTDLRKIYATEIAKALNQSAENQDYLQSAYQTTIDSYVATVLAAANYSDDAQKQIQEHLSTYVKRVESVFSQVQDNENITNALNSFIGQGKGDLSNLHQDEFDRVLNILLDNLALFGYQADDEMINVWKEAEKAANTAINEMGEDFKAASISGFNLIKQQLMNSQSASVNNLQTLEKLYRQAYKDSSLLGTDALTKLFQQLGDKTDDFLDSLDNISSLEELTQLLQDFYIDESTIDGFNRIFYSLRNLLNLGQEAPSSIPAFETTTSNYKEAKDITADLHYGDAISSDDYKILTAYNAAIAEFFRINKQGEYELIESATELNNIVDNISTDKLRDGLEEVNNKIITFRDILTNIDDINNTSISTNPDVFAENVDQQNAARSRAEYAIAMGGAGKLDSTRAEAILDMLDHHKLLTDDDLEALNSFKLTTEDINGIVNGLKESAEDYKNAMESRHEFDTDAGSIEDIEKYAEVLKEYGEEVYGISKDLMKNHQAAMLIAEDFLRAQAAAKEVASNIDDWRDVLKDPQKDLGKYIDTLEDVDNAYKDLLNLNNSAHLSEEFLSSAENLELMNQAIQGGTEGLAAYDQLVENVQKDILEQGLFDNEDGGFVIPASVDTAKLEESLLNHIDALQAELDGMNLEVGADIDDANFIAALNEMINMAGLTADQATALLASMGIDADVVEGPPLDTTNPSNYSYVSPAEYAIEPVGDVGDAIGGTFPYYATRLTKRAKVVTETGSQTDTSPASFAIHVENAKRGVGSGGAINHKKAGGLGGGGSTPKKSGGGGGGGSKPKTYTPLKPMKAKIDPYHDVNIKIGDTQEAIDKLQKERDKLIGKEAVKNLTKQIELMEQEKDLLKEKAGIAQGELQRQAQELANLGAIFNANGDIANYKDLLLNKQNQVNKAIEICNGLTGDEREAYEKYVKDLEQEYKDLEEAIKDFDETNQLLDDLGLDYQDIINKQIELAIEAFDLEINVKLDVKDAQREFNEFRKKVIDQVKDDQYGALATASARNYSQYYNIDENGNQGGIVLDLQRHAEAVQREAAKIQNGEWSSIYGNDLAAAADDLKKYNDELMKALEEAQDVIDETHQHFLDAIDAMDEAFDTQQENLDKLDDLLAHDMEILQLVHGEENFEEMNNLLEQQNQQDIKRLNALQKEQEYWQEKIDQYEEGTEEWEKAMANWQDAFEKTQDAMVQAIENVQKKWENSINSVMSKLRNQAYGGNMQSALEEWDKTTWHTDRYLDSLERANGLLNLQNKYINAINNTNDPKIQEKLAQLEEHQLNSLSQKTHLREIDLKIAEQQLTVLQAQIALEEAQASKTKLRLRRDSQGNYNYQYVADEENIQDKILTYANELENYRQMVKDNLREDLDAINEYTQEYFDKMAEAQMMFGDDSERLAERMEELADQYIGPDGYITLLANDSAEDQQELQKATVTTAIGLYDILQNKGAGLYGVLTTGAQGLLKGLGEGSQALADSINEGSISLIDALKTNYGDIDSLTDDFYDTIGAKSLAFLTGGDGSILELVDSLLNSNGGKIPDLLDLFKTDSFDPVIESLSQTSQDALFGPEGVFPEWGTAIADIAAKYEEEFLPTVSQAIEDLKKVHDEYKGKLDEIQEAAGRTFGDIALGLYFDTGYTNALNAATDALIQTQAAEVEAAEKVYDALKKNVDVFKESSAAAIQAANALFLFWLALNGQTASGLPYSVEGFDPNIGVTQPSITSLPPPEPSYNPESGGGGDTGSTGGSAQTTSANKQTDRGGTHGIARNATGIPTSITNSVGYGNWVNVGGKVVKLASGGYTGDWADEDGRLALLHKKEIVLNPEDTKNMLNTVQIVRGITDQVGAMTNAAATNFSGNSIMNALSSAGEQILQNVVINADFPAVQDAEQIKQAFNELVNLASQRASANRRVQ